MRYLLDVIKKNLILKKPPPGPRAARPEDRLRGCLEGGMAVVPLPTKRFTPLRKRTKQPGQRRQALALTSQRPVAEHALVA
jgi:hypothetical protein